jgi:hypothetical protein
MNPETVPIDIMLVLSTIAAVLGAVLILGLILLEVRRRRQDRANIFASEKLRKWAAASTTPADLSAKEALDLIEKSDAEFDQLQR